MFFSLFPQILWVLDWQIHCTFPHSLVVIFVGAQSENVSISYFKCVSDYIMYHIGCFWKSRERRVQYCLNKTKQKTCLPTVWRGHMMAPGVWCDCLHLVVCVKPTPGLITGDECLSRTPRDTPSFFVSEVHLVLLFGVSAVCTPSPQPMGLAGATGFNGFLWVDFNDLYLMVLTSSRAWSVKCLGDDAVELALWKNIQTVPPPLYLTSIIIRRAYLFSIHPFNC